MAFQHAIVSLCILMAQHKSAVSFITPERNTNCPKTTTRSQLQSRRLFFTQRNALGKVWGTKLSASTATGTDIKPSEQDEEKFDMPWSEMQEWALKDSLAKFTVIAPPGIDGKPTRRYAMWRTLTREVPELAGYPIPFLEQMHQRLVKKDASNPTTPGVLPMLDNYEFTPDGGIAGLAYGLPGIADGTRIQTPSLICPEKSVPLGYVTTQGELNSNDYLFSYELGTCASLSTYSSDAVGKSAVRTLAQSQRSVEEGAIDSSRQVANIAKDIAVSGSGSLFDTEANKDLVFSGATAMLLASATAVGILSHHLTINVFWV